MVRAPNQLPVLRRQEEGYDRLPEHRIQMYDGPCESRQEVSDVVGKVYNLCRVKTIRVAVVHGYGQLVRPHLWGSG